MRRLTVLAAVPFLLAVGCGGDADPGGQGSASPTQTPSISPSASVPSTTDIDAMLLAAADLGAGWTASAPEDAESDDTTPTATPTGACEIDDFGSDKRVAGRTVDLENESAGSFLNHQVEIYSAGGAAASIAEARAFFQRCSQLSAEEEGEKITMTVADWTGAPTYGDETLAKKLTASTGGVELSGGFIAIRQGDRLSVLFGLSASQQVEDYLPGAATRAADKLG